MGTPPEETSLPRPAEPLGEEELRKALVLARQGDREARERVVRSHLRLVWDIVRRFRYRGEDPEDLFQLGCVGLMKALERYDPSFGTRFSTYAVPLVIGEIRRHLRDHGPVRVSRRMRELAAAALRVREELTKSTGREPGAAEIARVLEVDPTEVVQAVEATRLPVSLFSEAGEEAGDPLYLIDRLAAGRDAAAAEAGSPTRTAGGEEAFLESLALKEALSRLEERDRRLLEMRFFEDKTQAEVGRILGVSQVQVSRLERRALLRLKSMLAP